jgi:hypothetical protein
MKRIPLTAAAVLAASLMFASAVWAFGVEDVVQINWDGISDTLILQKIQHSGTTFHLNAGDMRALKEEGVPDEIVSAMLATEDQPDYGYAYGPYYHPYYPYYPRVVVGLGLGFYPRYGYYGSRFRPFYGPRHFSTFAPARPGRVRYR